MHEHPHDHHHDHDDDRAGHHHPHHHAHHHDPGLGHNRARAATQWQVLHETAQPAPREAERDLDLVESSFVESFGGSSDPTSFLRLAAIPFVGLDAAGRRFHLLRVEMEALTDVGAVSPLIGGTGVRYDPLPAQMVSQRRRLAFVYHDGHALTRLSFAQARALRDDSGPSQFAVPHTD